MKTVEDHHTQVRIDYGLSATRQALLALLEHSQCTTKHEQPLHHQESRRDGLARLLGYRRGRNVDDLPIEVIEKVSEEVWLQAVDDYEATMEANFGDAHDIDADDVDAFLLGDVAMEHLSPP